MKRMLLLALGFSLTLSACAVPFIQPAATSAPPIDLAGTAEVFVQQTLQAQPTPTLVPSNTPVVTTPTLTKTPPLPTETQNAALLTLTATLGTGTIPAISGTPGTPTITATGTLPTSTATTTATVTATSNPAISVTPTETLHPRFFGTVPPNPPFGRALLINKSKAEAYISLQGTASNGVVTIIEYPVSKSLEAKIPAGKYLYVAWVGGNKMVGNFGIGKNEDVTITLYKDKVVITK